jgi:teichuronic acid biosynthesis glycosyltransferase TuaC
MSRILFLSSVYPRSYAPTRGIYCFLTCQELAVEHVVRVISPRSWIEALKCRSPGPSAEVGAVGSTEYPWYFHPPRVLQSHLGWFMWASIRRAVKRVVDEFQPDCVLSYWAHPDGEVAVRAARLAGVPSGIIVGGSDVLLLPQEPKRGRAVAGALRGADAVFAVSRDLQRRVIELGVDRERAHVVLQGVDARFTPGDRDSARVRLGLPREGKQLVWVGRMDPVKGLEVLIASCGLLTSRGIDFRLTLIGDGPARVGIERAIIEQGLSEWVKLAGAVRHEALPDWYRAADLTVLSSHSEGIPNVLRESLACGTPYVATRVGGIPELSDDPAIGLVPAADPVALANAIEEAFNSRAQLRSSADLGTWQDYAQALLRILLKDGMPDRQVGNLWEAGTK